MGSHIVNDEFQSDKYPTTPPGKVPLSVKDVSCQDLLWEYAQRRRSVDAEFSGDLEKCLLAAGYSGEPALMAKQTILGETATAIDAARDAILRATAAEERATKAETEVYVWKSVAEQGAAKVRNTIMRERDEARAEVKAAVDVIERIRGGMDRASFFGDRKTVAFIMSVLDATPIGAVGAPAPKPREEAGERKCIGDLPEVVPAPSPASSEAPREDASGPYSIGSRHWPGLSKLIEESGEMQQVVGKLLGTGGASAHWDGSNLRDRLQEELGDLLAAIRFVIEANDILDLDRIMSRNDEKLALFRKWHRGEK